MSQAQAAEEPIPRFERNPPDSMPPDPAVPGLWWVLHPIEGARAWMWLPYPSVAGSPGLWERGADSAIWPREAHDAGWRIYSVATPPLAGRSS